MENNDAIYPESVKPVLHSDVVLHNMGVERAETLNRVKTVANFLKNEGFEEFTFTGTVALEILGMPLGRKPGDVDVVILVYEKELAQARKLFRALQDVSGGKNYGDQWSYNFTVGNVNTSVFLCAPEKYREIPYVESQREQFTTAYHTLVQKCKLKRPKDYQDVTNITEEFMRLFHDKAI